MDLGAVKAAATPDLARCAVAAVVNAQGLLDDAEVLSAAGRYARSYALATLAVEEAGKAASLGALAMMPAGMRAQAPVGRMLEWHQLKLVGGMLMAAVSFGTAGVPSGTRCLAVQLADMPLAQVATVLDNVQALAQDQDRLKQRGLYADMDRGGRVQLPSEVTGTDVAAQLGRARRAVSAAAVLLDPGAPAFLADPPTEVIDFCRALVGAFAEVGYSRTAQAAAHVWLDAVGKARQQTPASQPGPAGGGP